MADCDYFIIGGGIAAYSASKKIRRTQPQARVVMATRDALPPYDLPPLSKEYLRGVKSEAELLYPSAAVDGVEILTGANVVSLDAQERRIQLDDGRTFDFSAALLATGADPIRLPVPGADLANVFYLRTAADGAAISRVASAGRRAVVIGAGFIGLEIAASLTLMGCKVTIIEAMERIWPRFGDASIAEVVHSDCAARGVRFLMSETVVEIAGSGAAQTVITASGERVACDFVIVGIGIRPNVALARQAGLSIDNGVVVDAGMRTSAPGVFAAGDAVNYLDPIPGRRMRGEHWGHAEYSGQLAGANMCGGDNAYDFMNYAWSDVFDLHIESAGHIEEYDEVVLRGHIEDRRFTALYLRQNVLLAYCAVNCEPVDFASYRRLIRNRQDLSGRLQELSDPDVRARSLVQA
ncbi:MAG: FAD-dependent oxidoreductase [Brevundimonas sp.]|jgi:NADPH-dependent 2,4-dienoyl-CoA reductase/sulfur reductase-like enzyme|uniref:NAD(P)/FAD-dependent oxidoreductase n=1 Tax=Brevundimonas sp. TaxID=1871086 RepID=UPI0025BF4114|nr:FAD-dependent oxidoreductase [Brevundimonas sp.]MCH4269704.1 FAD-dependent oxidoreductase [Brevundimonas sp.]